MCGGVYYKKGDEVVRTYFPNPKAQLPVMTADGDTELVQWGRREGQEGNLPMTGWARLDSIRAGKWKRCAPIPVKIPVLSFMEKDYQGQSHRYDLDGDQFIQGLLAQSGHEKRVYVVTIQPTEEQADIHNRWPRVLSEDLA
jgi:putative SOS response-associated peptidase YedK